MNLFLGSTASPISRWAERVEAMSIPLRGTRGPVGFRDIVPGGDGCGVHRDQQQGPVDRVHGGIPELHRVHLAQAFVARQADFTAPCNLLRSTR
jgi:hypothetical protein